MGGTECCHQERDTEGLLLPKGYTMMRDTDAEFIARQGQDLEKVRFMFNQPCTRKFSYPPVKNESTL
jgi:hypothetical protein